MNKRWRIYIFYSPLGVALVSILLLIFAITIAYPKLPSIELLTSYQPKIPLQIYSREGDLIGEFGDEIRNFVKSRLSPFIRRFERNA